VTAIHGADVLLVGGGVAAVRCARTLRREGFAGSILLVGSEPEAPYNRPPLSKELLRGDAPEELVAAEPPTWYARRGIDLGVGMTVTRLDPEAQVATLDDGTGVRFERALLATGAEPIALPVPGSEHGLSLRTLADARRLRGAASAAAPGARVAVVGGGFIGVEVASGLATLGLRPVVIERVDALWGGALGPRLSAWAVDRLSAAGVEVRLGAAVTALTDRSVLLGGEELEVGFAVVGVGVRPRVALAVGAGLAVDDGVVTDAAQRTGHPAIWAAGDVARIGAQRFEHWHAARESGERAARSMLGHEPGSIPVPWLFSEVAGVSVDVVGTTGSETEEAWIADGAVLAYSRAGRVVGLASIDGAVAPEDARRLVADGADHDALAEAVRGAAER
jgi:3-phenylpropionate/trans-cinnamate dioxygenase ferredoxin reductase subunit